LEKSFPSKVVIPFVETDQRIPVSWNEENRSTLKARIERLSVAYPKGTAREARELSSPGVHCSRCRIRHRCSAYIEAAPEWWGARQENPRPLPLDAWGTVFDMQKEDGSISLRIHDPMGRRILIEGLSTIWNLEDVSVGAHLWFFDLQTSEPVLHHGARIHPRNFHETPSGPWGKPARTLIVFAETSKSDADSQAVRGLCR
jgi:hypothetical protein